MGIKPDWWIREQAQKAQTYQSGKQESLNIGQDNHKEAF